MFFPHKIRSIHSVNKNLSEFADKIDETLKNEIQTALDEAKAVPSTADVETIKAKSSALNNLAMKIGQSVYGKGNQGSSNPTTEESDEDKSKKNAESTDAEFKEKK